MRRIVKSAVVFLLAAMLLAQSAFAAGDRVSSITLNQVRQNGAELTMYVNLYDESGRPVTGSFDPDQFAVSVDGTAAAVESVTAYDPAVQSIHYVFAVDVSLSMTTAMMDSVRAALSAFVEKMGPKDTVTIITFGETVKELLSDNGSKTKIQETIAGIQATDMQTALYEGVITAASDAKGGRSAVVVITDGKNTVESATKEEIFAQLQRSQVPVYCIGLNDNDGVDPESPGQLAAATGGAAIVGSAGEAGGNLDKVYDMVCGAAELHATMVNPDGRTSFDQPSTFRIGMQTDSSFITSNELQQIVNWTNVPGPAAEVTPTPIPQISLELDESSTTVMLQGDGKAVISGLVAVEQGVVDGDSLSITVNDEPWNLTNLMRNGNDYTFSAEGVIPSSTSQLNVRAVLKTEDGSNNIASRVQTVEVVAPTATPAPVLAVELDDLGRDIEYEADKAVTISGTINTQGSVDPSGMELYINGEPCEMTVAPLQANQYEFSAETALPEEVISELRVQIVLNGANVRSHAQSIPLVTPTPMPDPELSLTLTDDSIEYESGEPITITGNIEIVSGEVQPEDLALYVNSARWNMTLETLGDGTFYFEAAPEHELVGQLDELDVRVRLESNNQISSDMVTMAVTTPEPPATPAPTARPKVTPPPTKVPSPTTPVTAEDEEAGQETGSDGMQTWYYVAGGAALLLLIIVAVVAAAKRKGKSKITPTDPPQRDPNDARASAQTVRGDEDLFGGNETVEDATIKDGTVEDGTVKDRIAVAAGFGEEFVNEADDSTADRGGTGTVRLDQNVGGTVRLDEASSGTGTVRLDEERWGLAVTAEEKRNGRRSNEPREMMLGAGEEVVFGRNSSADAVVDDTAVSGRHLRLSFDGEGLYVCDLGSTNGTKVNGVKLESDTPRRLETGDTVVIGKTTLVFSFGKPELY